ncbi:MAG: Omp28-related outer membrane protein [Flavobacteriales bacterium]|nr:Omp28-related outer membrane protein [Flavobacteriales bacterium]
MKNVKKISVWLVFASLWLGCKEALPPIDFTEPIKLLRDTTYIADNLPVGVQKNVLLEDISGVRCTNCPKAAVIAHELKDSFPDRVVVMTLHTWELSTLTAPYVDSKDTLNTEVATEIVSNLIGKPNGLPAGAIDRRIFSGSSVRYINNYNSWRTLVHDILKEEPVADINLSLVRTGDNTVNANIKTTFLKGQSEAVFLSVFLIESGIVSNQEMPDVTINNDYVHNDILRMGITPYAGIKLADNVEVGRVFEKGIPIEIPKKYNQDNCSIVVLVNFAGSNSDVLQCVEAHVN